MYYKIIAELHDKICVYKETPLDEKHPDYGVEKQQLRTSWNRDYFIIKNGNIKLISGRDETEFDGVTIEYPKGTKEVCLFMERNKGLIVSVPDEIFLKDYKLNQHRNNLCGDLMKIDMILEDCRAKSENPPTAVEKKNMNRLWNERDRIVKQISKLEKKEQLLLLGKDKKKEYKKER